MDLVTVSRLQRNPTVKAEIAMRGFADEIEVKIEDKKENKKTKDKNGRSFNLKTTPTPANSLNG